VKFTYIGLATVQESQASQDQQELKLVFLHRDDDTRYMGFYNISNPEDSRTGGDESISNFGMN
jgi:hypothetical protein